MNNVSDIKEIYSLVDDYFKKGLFTRVAEKYYNSARAILTLATAFNKAIDYTNFKYDEYFKNYVFIEKQVATVFKKLKQAFKNRKIVVDALDSEGNPTIINMDADEFFDCSIDQLERCLNVRHIPFNKKYFK